MELRSVAPGQNRARASLLAIALLGTSSAVFWNMRARLEMDPAVARDVLRDPTRAPAERRNAIAATVIDFRQGISDLREHAQQGDQFAIAALRQIRAAADEALR